MIHDLPAIKAPRASSPLRIVFRAFAHSLAAVLAVWAGVVQAADSQAYERALVAGKTKLEAGQIDAALRDFQQAVQADSSQYEGFFYLAVASFRSGNHAAALEYGNAAVAAAKDQEKPRARELVEAIRKAKETEELVRQGDEAHGKGLNAKAADLYARAFQLSPDRGDIGLKAATLYANRLGRLFEAAVLYQDVIASGDAAAANAAGSELGALHEPLQQLYREELPRAVARGDLQSLEKLSKAFPHEAQPRLEVAALQAAKGDGEAVANWLGEAVKLGTGYSGVQARTVFLDLWEKGSSAFKSFVADAFGTTAVADMDQRLQSRQAKQAEERRLAAEKARADQLAREQRQREEQLAQEQVARESAARPLRTQLRTPLVAELNRLFQASPVKKIRYRRIRGQSHDSTAEYDVTIGLQGDRYVITTTRIFERWGGRLGHRIDRTVMTYTFDSLTKLNTATVEHESYAAEYPKGFHGSAEKLRTMTLKVSGYILSTVTHSSDSPGSPTHSSTDTVMADFFVQDLADGARIVAIVRELKAIDSLSLEQLREKTG